MLQCLRCTAVPLSDKRLLACVKLGRRTMGVLSDSAAAGPRLGWGV
jgi:hypothetical protein